MPGARLNFIGRHVRWLALSLAVLSGINAVAADPSWSYLKKGHPDPLVVLPPPPLANSPDQAADMAAVAAVHGACSTNDALAAFSEKKFGVFNFAPAAGPWFSSNSLPKTTAFFKRVQKDAAAVADQAKDIWKRPRPFMVDPSLASGPLEKTFSYPSGHSTESYVLALTLAELVPDRRDGILAVARSIAWHRIQIARHYPTDIYAGRVLAMAIFNEMKKSPDFQKDLEAAREEIAEAAKAAKN